MATTRARGAARLKKPRGGHAPLGEHMAAVSERVVKMPIAQNEAIAALCALGPFYIAERCAASLKKSALRSCETGERLDRDGLHVGRSCDAR